MPYANKEKAKEYNRQYHLRTWIKRKDQHLKNKQKRREKLSIWLYKYKSLLSCSVCQENNPICLDFHHTNSQEKENSVANMVSEGYSIKSILREIRKCIILCRNCHAKKHYSA